MIDKNEKISKGTKMSDIILNNHFMILVLERFGIELGLHDKTIELVCKDNNINIEVFLTILNLYNDNTVVLEDDFERLDVEAIIRYLENSHRYYIDEVFPEIVHNIHLMSEYNSKPEILMIEEFFSNYREEVDQHLDYEDKTVFPYILNLFKNKEVIENERNYSVSVYKEHHDDIEEKLDDLKKLLIQHLPPKNDQIIRRKVLFALFNLEYDLIIHAKIENEILIPLVEILENNSRNN